MSTLSAPLRATEPTPGCLEKSELLSTLLLKQPATYISSLTVILVGFSLFFYRLGDRDLWSSHEARAAQDAQSVLNGQWLVPQLFDGRFELQKPPLYYWCIATWCRLTGRPVDALAVRLPATLSALIIMATLIVLGYLFNNLLAGVLAAATLFLTPHFVWLARVGRVDLPLTACLTVAFAAWLVRSHLGNSQCQYLSLLLAFLSLAAGLLIKGPIAIVLFSLVVLWNTCCEKMFVGNPCHTRQLSGRIFLSPLAAMTAVLITAPVLIWYIAANEVTGGEWVREFLYRHNLTRGLGTDPRLDRHSHWLGPAFYVVRLPLDFGPTILLAIWLAIKNYQCPRGNKILIFSANWFLMCLAFFSCMRYKRADYLLPAYPALALFIGFGLAQHLKELTKSARRWWYIAYTLAVALSLISWLAYITWVLPTVDGLRQQRDFADLVRRHYGPGEPVYMFGTDAHLLSYHLGPPIQRTFDPAVVASWLPERNPLCIVVARKSFPQLQQIGQPNVVWAVIATNKRSRSPWWYRWWNQEEDEALLLVRASRAINWATISGQADPSEP